MKKITPERLEQLNLGLVEASNLMETLSINYQKLLSFHFPEFTFPIMDNKLGITKKIYLLATELYQQLGFVIFDQLKSSQSDSLRNLACYFIAHHYSDLKEQLEAIKILADDSHSGVREWAWMAIRPAINSNILLALELLQSWTQDCSPRIRRFASEATRPRGVWCAHNYELRQAPWLGINLLTALNNDEHKYVQLSVGNWLNDAAKDHPEWVKEICTKWQANSPSSNTQKICKRALRNLL